MTGKASSPRQHFAFSNAAALQLRSSSTEQTPLQLGLGKAANAAASAGTAVGHLFGFSAPDLAKSRSAFSSGAFGGLGSGFSFAAGGHSAALPSGLRSYTRAVAAEAAAEEEERHSKQEVQASPADEEGEDEEEGRVEAEDYGQGEEAESEMNEGEADTNEDESPAGAEQSDKELDADLDDQEGEAQGEDNEEDEDESHFALPDDLLSDDGNAAEQAAAAEAAAHESDDASGISHGGHSDDAEEAESHAEEAQSQAESEATADKDDEVHAGAEHESTKGNTSLAEGSEGAHGDQAAASQLDEDDASCAELHAAGQIKVHGAPPCTSSLSGAPLP